MPGQSQIPKKSVENLLQQLRTSPTVELLSNLLSATVHDVRAFELYGSDGVETSAYPIVLKHIDELVPLLDHNEKSIRLAALRLLSAFPAKSEKILQAITKLESRKLTDGEKASILIARGLLQVHNKPDSWEFSVPDVPKIEWIQACAVISATFLLDSYRFIMDPGQVAPLEKVVENGLTLDDFAFFEGNFSDYAQAIVDSLQIHRPIDPSAYQYDYSSTDEDQQEIRTETQPDPDEELITQPYLQDRPQRSAPAFELEGLDDVPWSDLEEAYGKATWIPEMLKGLISPDQDDRDWAIDALFASINHQGSVYSSAQAAVPFLVQILGKTKLCDPAEILRLLTGIAVHDSRFQLEDGGMRSPYHRDVCQSAEVFIEFIDHPDFLVRIAASQLCGYLDLQAQTVIPKIRDRISIEKNPYVRGTLLIALGILALSADLVTVSDVDLVRTFLESAGRLDGVAASISLVYLLDEKAPKEALSTLDDIQRQRFQARFFPWLSGDVAEFARLMRQNILTPEELIGRLEVETDHSVFHTILSKAVEKILSQPDPGGPLVLPGDLSAEQQQLLRIFVDREQANPQILSERLLPSKEPDLRRFLGLDNGPLDDRIATKDGTRPVWYLIYEAASSRLTDIEPLITSGTEQTRLTWVQDALLGAYHLSFLRAPTDYANPESMDQDHQHHERYILTLAKIAESAGTLAFSWAKEAAEKVLHERPIRSVPTGLVAALVLGRANQLGPEFDRLIILDAPPVSIFIKPLRELLGAIPIERRQKLLELVKLFSFTETTDPSGTRYQWRKERGFELADLCPTPQMAEKVLESLKFWESHQEGRPAEGPIGGKVRKSHVRTVQPDDNFPMDQVAKILTAHGKVALEPIQKVLSEGHIKNRKFLEQVLEKISEAPV